MTGVGGAVWVVGSFALFVYLFPFECVGRLRLLEEKCDEMMAQNGGYRSGGVPLEQHEDFNAPPGATFTKSRI